MHYIPLLFNVENLPERSVIGNVAPPERSVIGNVLQGYNRLICIH